MTMHRTIRPPWSHWAPGLLGGGSAAPLRMRPSRSAVKPPPDRAPARAYPDLQLPLHVVVTLALVAVLVSPASSQEQQGLPGPLEKVGYDQKLGETVPLDLEFLDEQGHRVTLGNYFGERPVILSLVYYRCPMLCSMILDGLARSLSVLRFDPGQEFDVVVVSFDSRETPTDAHEALVKVLKRYERPGTEEGWHFLTGGNESIRRLTETVGFRYEWDPESNQFAHAAGIMTLTPEGRIAHYFFGIDYAPRDVRLGLIEAADNQIGTMVDQVLLYCFHYDPVTGKYSAVTMNIIRVGAVITLLALGLFIGLHLWRERRRRVVPAKA